MNRTEVFRFLMASRELVLPTNWIVITGAPSSGKTTLIRSLENEGFLSNLDISRALIEQGLRRGLTIDEIFHNESGFQENVLIEMINNALSLPPEEIIFHDYSMPDNIPFLRLLGLPVTEEYVTAARLFKYKMVFKCTPLPLEQDGIRREDISDQMRLDQDITRVYTDLGYQVIDLPPVPVFVRKQIILGHLTQPT